MKKYKNHLIAFAICLFFSIVYIIINEIWNVKNSQEIFKLLSNAFFVPGFLMFGIGLLVFTSNEGVFDMLKYGISRIINSIKKDIDDVKYKNYYEYVKAVHEKDAKFSHLLIAGLLEIFISVIFLILYMSI